MEIKTNEGHVVKLNDHDVALTETARLKLKTRKLLRFIKWLVVPVIIAQALQFGSFMYEEALQQAGFSANILINSQDQAFAYDAVKTFERLMKQAQLYHNRLGRYAFWTSPPFEAYFGQAAPAQLAGLYAQGKKLGLWNEDARRFVEVIDKNTGKFVVVDTMGMSPIKKLEAMGFDPQIVSSERCLVCRDGKKDEGEKRK